MKNLLPKMSIDDLLLAEGGEEERQKRDQAMLEAQFLLRFLKAPGKRTYRNRKNKKKKMAA
jgi:hypothetical protein